MTPLFMPWLSCLCSLSSSYVWHGCWQVNDYLGCTYKLTYCLFFLLFVCLMWVTYLFYLIFTFWVRLDTTYFYWKLKIENTVAKLFLNMWIVSWTVHEQCTCLLHNESMWSYCSFTLKKKEKCKKCKCEPKNVNPNTHFIYSTFSKS